MERPAPAWHRVRRLKPRLRAHTEIHRHGFRGQVWYVLEDRAAGRFFRFRPDACWRSICRMDGSASVEEILRAVRAEEGHEALDEDGMVQLLAQLHRAGALHADVVPDVGEMVERVEAARRRRRILGFLNPLAIRVPLLDPERFIAATYPLLSPVLSVGGLAAMVLLVAYAALQAGTHWDELTGDLLDRLLTVQTAALMLIAYPAVKLVHELGHAYTIKRWGGEVHELGVMMLVFMPVPYVDATSASAFPSKWSRALVGAAGIIVELVLAAVALLLWLEVQPGLFRAFLFNVMLIGGVSTLLFNGNPLLRFDGYYVLSDLLEIPNLAQRANRYVRYWVLSRLFGVSEAKSPVTAPGEAAWFAFYAPAAFIYRLFVMAAILIFIGQQAFLIGAALAVWTVVLVYLLPLLRCLRYLLQSPELRGRRGRALKVTGGLAAALAALLGIVPLPYATLAEGVVTAPGETRITAETAGFVERVLVDRGAQVARGDALMELTDPLLDMRIAAIEAEVAELEARLRAARAADQGEARIVSERLVHARAEAEREHDRRRALVVRAPAAGSVAIADFSDIGGRHVSQGELLGHVIRAEDLTIQVSLGQEVIDLVRSRGRGVSVRLAGDFARTIEAGILRQTPAAVRALPNAALATVGGGPLLPDPADAAGTMSLEPVFLVELAPREAINSGLIGQRAFVRFDHGKATIAFRGWRALRQLFLSRFDI